jgi:hypothetical protein
MRNIKMIKAYPISKTMSEVVYLDLVDGKLKTMLLATSLVKLNKISVLEFGQLVA